MGMIIENNQSWTELREEIKVITKIIEYVYELKGEVLRIFWTTGGKHARNSLHYKRRAVDFNGLKEGRDEFIRKMRYILGKDYDIIDEVDHIHIEWDPK